MLCTLVASDGQKGDFLVGFGNNSKLVTSAKITNIAADGLDGGVYNGTDAADAFVVADGNIGDDLIVGFSHNDTIITKRMIGDGYVPFGDNHSLAVNDGAGQLAVLGNGSQIVTALRYLGGKDGGFAYADAGTRDHLFGHFATGIQSTNTNGGDSSIAQALRIDNAVTDNVFNMGATSVALLTDNALGLNFGSDTINGFGDDDLLIFTTKILNKEGSGGLVTFGKNLVLDASGAEGPSEDDAAGGPGGQMDFNAANQKCVYYLGEKAINGSVYYYYGTAHADIPEGVGSGA